VIVSELVRQALDGSRIAEIGHVQVAPPARGSHALGGHGKPVAIDIDER
jgi:hypothetical protein